MICYRGYFILNSFYPRRKRGNAALHYSPKQISPVTIPRSLSRFNFQLRSSFIFPLSHRPRSSTVRAPLSNICFLLNVISNAILFILRSYRIEIAPNSRLSHVASRIYLAKKFPRVTHTSNTIWERVSSFILLQEDAQRKFAVTRVARGAQMHKAATQSQWQWSKFTARAYFGPKRTPWQTYNANIRRCTSEWRSWRNDSVSCSPST